MTTLAQQHRPKNVDRSPLIIPVQVGWAKKKPCPVVVETPINLHISGQLGVQWCSPWLHEPIYHGTFECLGVI